MEVLNIFPADGEVPQWENTVTVPVWQQALILNMLPFYSLKENAKRPRLKFPFSSSQELRIRGVLFTWSFAACVCSLFSDQFLRRICTISPGVTRHVSFALWGKVTRDTESETCGMFSPFITITNDSENPMTEDPAFFRERENRHLVSSLLHKHTPMLPTASKKEQQ